MLDTRENTKNIAILALVVQKLSKSMEATGKRVSDMVASINTLGRIDEIHEHRFEGESA